MTSAGFSWCDLGEFEYFKNIKRDSFVKDIQRKQAKSFNVIQYNYG